MPNMVEDYSYEQLEAALDEALQVDESEEVLFIIREMDRRGFAFEV